jgi:hypothetical protein
MPTYRFTSLKEKQPGLLLRPHDAPRTPHHHHDARRGALRAHHHAQPLLPPNL